MSTPRIIKVGRHTVQLTKKGWTVDNWEIQYTSMADAIEDARRDQPNLTNDGIYELTS